MFEVKIKQLVSSIFTNDVLLLNKNYCCVNDMQYSNKDIEFINKVK